MADNDPTTPDEFECKVRAEFNYTRYPCAVDLAQPGPTPDQSKGLPVSTDLVTPVKAEVTNRLRESILATQYELGLKPSGTYGTVRARLDAMESLIAELFRRVRALEEGGGTGVGTIHVKDEGSTILTHAKILNFIGDAVTVTAPNTVQADITITGGLVMIQVQETAPVTSGGQTAFTLSYVPQDDTAVFMFVNGIKQEHGVDYTVVNKNVTYAYGTLLTTDIVEFWYIAEGSTVQQKQESFTAGAGDTSFSLTEVPQDDTAVFMFVNGIKQQHGVDYTVLIDQVTYSGPTLSAGDIVEFWYIVGVSGGAGGVNIYNNGNPVQTGTSNLDFLGPEWIINTVGSDTVTIALSGDGYEPVQDTLAVTSDAQTAFVLTNTPTDDTAVEFFIAGIKQEYGVDYTVSGTALTYNDTDLLIGDDVSAVYYTTGGDTQQDKVQETLAVTGDAQTVFTLSQTPVDDTKVEFFIEGIKQEYGVSFTVSGTTVTYNDTDILLGDVVEAVYFVGSTSVPFSPMLQTQHAAIAAQTEFPLVSVPADVSDVELFIEGIKQEYSTDYTVSGSMLTYNHGDILVDDIVDTVLFRGDGSQLTWAEVLLNGRFSGGTDPTISYGDVLRGQHGSDLNLAATGGGNIVLTPDGYVAVMGKLYVSGLIDPTGLVLDGQSSTPGGTPGTSKGTIWVSSADGYLFFTDQNGVDYNLLAGGAGGGAASMPVQEVLPVGFDGQTAFSLSQTPTDDDSIQLFVSGAKQEYGVDYTVLGSAVTWTGTQTLLTTDVVEAYYFVWGAGPSMAWDAVLAAGNTSGGTDPVISTGDVIRGQTDLNLMAADVAGGTPGNLSLLAGSVTAPGGAGGDVAITGGDGYYGPGGDITIKTGGGTSSGQILITGPNINSSGGAGANINIYGGNVVHASGGSGGTVALAAGATAGASGYGGWAYLQGGQNNSAAPSGTPGSAKVTGGRAVYGGDGANAIVEGGRGYDNGGNVILNGGKGDNGHDGYVIVQRDGAEVARWDNGGSERLLLSLDGAHVSFYQNNMVMEASGGVNYIRTPDATSSNDLNLKIGDGTSSSGRMYLRGGDVPGGSGGAIDIQTGQGVWGGSLNVNAGAGTSGSGGAISINSGSSSSVGGGNLTLNAGDGYTGGGVADLRSGDAAGPGAAGGYLRLWAGSHTGTNGFGGYIDMRGGTANGAGCYGGNINLACGNGGAYGGAVSIQAGDGGTQSGGNVGIGAGDGETWGGNATLGAGRGMTEAGGALGVYAGRGYTDGGNATVYGGQGDTGHGGHVYLRSGRGDNDYDGYVIVERYATEYARWDEYWDWFGGLTRRMLLTGDPARTFGLACNTTFQIKTQDSIDSYTKSMYIETGNSATGASGTIAIVTGRAGPGAYTGTLQLQSRGNTAGSSGSAYMSSGHSSGYTGAAYIYSGDSQTSASGNSYVHVGNGFTGTGQARLEGGNIVAGGNGSVSSTDVTAGNNLGTGNAGTINIYAGDAVAGDGGYIYMTAGDGYDNPGHVSIYSGNSSHGPGGSVNINGGSGPDYGSHISVNCGSATNDVGGNMNLTAGNGKYGGGWLNIGGGDTLSGGSGNGGYINVYGGAAMGDGDGGDVILKGGLGAGSGHDGYIILIRGTTEVARWDGGGSERLLMTNTSVVEFPLPSTTAYVRTGDSDVSVSALQIQAGTGQGVSGGVLNLYSGTAYDGTGGSLRLIAGSGLGTGSGGGMDITAGDGYGSGGAINMRCGHGTNGGGGNLNVTAGNGVTSSGYIYLSAGGCSGSGTAGEAYLKAGANSGTGTSGGVQISGGRAYGASASSNSVVLESGRAGGASGPMFIKTGQSDNSFSGGIDISVGNGVTNGGSMLIRAGTASAGYGGTFTMNAGSGSTYGGHMMLNAGGGGSSYGGSFYLTAGTSGSSGNGGDIILNTGGGAGGGQDGSIICKVHGTEVSRFGNSYLSIGTNGVTSGALRIPNNTALVSEESGGTDRELIKLNGANQLVVGNTGTATTLMLGSTAFYVSLPSDRFKVTNTLTTLYTDTAFASSVSTPRLYQENGTTGQTFTIQAQNSTASAGGNLELLGGNALTVDYDGGSIILDTGNADGFGTDGYVIFKRAGSEVARFDHNGDLDVAGHNIVDVADPVDPQDVATKSYTDKDYGGVSVTDNSNATTLTTQNTWYQFDEFDTDNVARGATPSATDGYIIVGSTGHYEVTVAISFEAGGALQDYEWVVQADGDGAGAGAFSNLKTRRDVSTAAQIGSAVISGLVALTAGEKIELWARCISTGSTTITGVNVTMSIKEL